MRKNTKRILKATLLSLVFIILASALFTVSANEEFLCTIDSVKINAECDKINITASLEDDYVQANKDKTVYFFELLPSNNADNLNSLTPIANADISQSLSKSVSFKKMSLYSSFVLALQNDDGTYTAITDNKYVQNPEILAENSEPYPTRPTKKGLCTQISSDAQYLGAAHTIISIDIGEYMSAYQGNSTVAFTRYGQTFYFYEDKLAALDHKVKVLTDAGMNVYFNIVLGNSALSGLNFMYLNSASSTASLFAINTTTVPSSRYFTVFCEFMTERYSSKSHENGFVPAYILGYEVNSTGTWNYAGEVSFADYVNYYENAYRILYSAVRSTYKNGKVFVSVSNYFNSDESSADFGAKDFLCEFSSNMSKSGDTEWSLAINPYASDPANTEFWNDESASDSLDTPYITMKNLDVLSEFMRSDEMTYKGNVRDIIISEFGISGDYTDARNSDCQAGAYALAYAIADANEDIDAFKYYRHVDHPSESVKFGLWTSGIGTLTPENKKPIYSIFRNADTSAYNEGLDMARAFCGEDIYNKYLASYVPSARRVIIETIPVMKSDIRTTFKEKVLFDLTAGELCNFYPSDSSSYVELRPISNDDYSTELYSLLKPVSAQTYSGISRNLEGIEFDKAEYMTLSFKPVTPSEETLTVMLRLDSELDGIVYSYEGIVQLTSNTESELTFKIADYIKATDGSIGSLKLWYKPSSLSTEGGEYGLWLKNITVHEKTGLSAFVTVLITCLSVLLALIIIGAIIFVYRSKTIRNRIKGIIGKTKSKIIGFLKDKKIISRRPKKKKGARLTPPKQSTQPVRVPHSHNTSTGVGNVSGTKSTSGARIVNGRVVTPSPSVRRHAENANRLPHEKVNEQNRSKNDNSQPLDTQNGKNDPR